MKPRVFHFLLAFFVFFLSGGISWSQSTPQAALEELITTDKIEVAQPHYPEAFRRVLDALKKEDRAQTARRLLVKEWLRQQHHSLRKNSAGGWELLSPEGEKILTYSITDTYFSGNNALLRLQISSAEQKGEGATYFISMRLDGGDWQVTGFGAWLSTNIDSDEFVRRFIPTGDNEMAAQSTLQQIREALFAYRQTYRQAGYPSTLQTLSGPEQTGQDIAQQDAQVEENTVQDSDADQAPPPLEPPQYSRLLDPSFLEPHVIKDGYEFRYTLIDPGVGGEQQGKFRLTATPVEFGKTGGRSFFMDESGQIRYTAEQREANENDQILPGSPGVYPPVLPRQYDVR